MAGQDPFPNLLSLVKNQQDFPEVIAYSQGVTAELLEFAYKKGIFPWPSSPASESPPSNPHADEQRDELDSLIPWCSPFERGVLLFDELRCSSSFSKWLRREEVKKWRVTLDQDFAGVIQACSQAPRAEGQGSWITEAMIAAYLDLHHRGQAHSVEVWDEHRQLVGGLYGVDVGRIFCGESMFYKKTNASKAALWFFCRHLKGRGYLGLDTQMVTPVVAQFGGKLVNRSQFLEFLNISQKIPCKQSPWDQKELYPVADL